LEIRHLRYFVTVACESSLARAARKLGITQPGLSRAIQELEAELNQVLLNRSSGGVSLTHAGQIFLEQASAVVAAFEKLEANYRVDRDGERSLRVYYSFHAQLKSFSIVLKVFREAFRDTAFDLVYEQSPKRILELIRENPGSIGLAYIGHLQVPADVEREVLFTGHFWIGIPSEHPLSSQRSVTLEQIAGKTILVNAAFVRAEYGNDFENLLSRYGITIRVTNEGLEIPDLMALISTGDEFIFAPSLYKVPQPGLRYVKMENYPEYSAHVVTMRTFMDERIRFIFEQTEKLRSKIQDVAEPIL
jgi:LysR family transcriptional regulator, benzoate and cis,cis-muconate-responsive activator of ben and cat genes